VKPPVDTAVLWPAHTLIVELIREQDESAERDRAQTPATSEPITADTPAADDDDDNQKPNV